MKSEVIVLDRGIFSKGAQLPKKNTKVQNNHRRIHTYQNKDGAKLLLSLITAFRHFKYILGVIYEEIIY